MYSFFKYFFQQSQLKTVESSLLFIFLFSSVQKHEDTIVYSNKNIQIYHHFNRQMVHVFSFCSKELLDCTEGVNNIMQNVVYPQPNYIKDCSASYTMSLSPLFSLVANRTYPSTISFTGTPSGELYNWKNLVTEAS